MTERRDDAEAILSAIEARERVQRWASATEANCAAILAWLRRPEPGDPQSHAQMRGEK